MSGMTQPTRVRQVLDELGFRPSKVLGQNFLIDGNILRIILDAAELQAGDVVLEIGPGLGAVTEALLPAVDRVVAVEKDRRLCEWLRRSQGASPGFRLIEGDALELDLGGLLAGGVTKLVSNLPYSVGSRILHDVFQSSSRPGRIVVMHQLDVAQRLVAKPGGGDYGLLSIWGQMYYDISIRKIIRAPCYYPAPKITSALLEMRLRTSPQAELADSRLFGRLVKHAFSQRRKQIGGVLRGQFGVMEDEVAGWLSAHGLSPRSRPEEIPVAQWGALANWLCRRGPVAEAT